MTHKIVVTTTIGIEEATEKEVIALGLPVISVHRGAVSTETENFCDIYRLNFCLRSATRVLLHLTTFPCRNERDLYEGSVDVSWEDFFPTDIPFVIETSGVRTLIRNSLFAAQKVKDAICDRMRKLHNFRPSVDTKNPKIRFFLHLDGREAHLYFDTSGRPLHERGWRREVPIASLRENIAAALVLMAEPTENDVIVDPCAGSGTLLIETLLYLMKIPPQYRRREFAFYMHPKFRFPEWDAIRKEAMSLKREIVPHKQFLASEIDEKTFKLLERNIKTCGFEDFFEAVRGDFRKVSFSKKPNFLITNMPYGMRLGDIDSLGPLYQDLGNFMKQKMEKPSRGYVLGTQRLIKCIGLKTRNRHELINGGIECRFVEYDVF